MFIQLIATYSCFFALLNKTEHPINTKSTRTENTTVRTTNSVLSNVKVSASIPQNEAADIPVLIFFFFFSKQTISFFKKKQHLRRSQTSIPQSRQCLETQTLARANSIEEQTCCRSSTCPREKKLSQKENRRKNLSHQTCCSARFATRTQH